MAEQMTYGELRSLALKMCTYFQSQNIGTDDFVMIRMQRGIGIIAAMFSTWIAGSACVVCETSMPSARIEEIYTDCNCRTTITEETLTDILALEPKYDFKYADDHDAAFAVYTSGSTGKPKGVIHEFGKLDLILKVDSVQDYNRCDQTVSCIAPLNTIVAVLLLVPALANACILDIIPNEVIHDPRRMLMALSRDNVGMMFIPPSYLRVLPIIPKSLQVIFVGSESAVDVYRDGVQIFNGYALSESGFTALYHIVQPNEGRSPIGTSPIGLKTLILDDNGNEAAPGELGELVLENPYTRGYIHSENNGPVFKNGMLYTGDIVRCNPDGEIMLINRKDDMIKIHGNRIEPAEISEAVKCVSGLKRCEVKGFSDEQGTCICVYYLDDIEIDESALRSELGKMLPEYMIPTHYMRLEAMPLLPNGKLDRNHLPRPEVTGSRTNIEPGTQLEKQLCDAFRDILRLENVSVEDDFFLLGGDSISAMELLDKCPGLDSFEMLIKARTPRAIAALIASSETISQDDLNERNRRAMQKAHPLSGMQRYMIRYQFGSLNTTMWNLSLLMRFDPMRISPEQMQTIIVDLVSAHPALQTIITLNRNGYLEQKMAPERMEAPEITHTTEAEFEVIKKTLVRPFDLFDSPLQRSDIYVTEKCGYIFWDLHHSIIDGFSLKNLRHDFIRHLNGEPIPTDYYYLNLEEDELAEGSDLYREAGEYYARTYGGNGMVHYPPIDHEYHTNTHGTVQTQIDFAENTTYTLCKKYDATVNELCMAAFLLAVAQTSKKSDVQCTWLYHGRNDRLRKNTVGLMFRTMPIAMHFNESTTIRGMLASIREQFRSCMMYNCYPYALDMFDGLREDRASCFYQADIDDSSALEAYGIENIDIDSKYGASCGILDLCVTSTPTGLLLTADFAGSRYTDETMSHFLHMTAQNLKMFSENENDTINTVW